MRALIALLALATATPALAELPVEHARVIRAYPHDTGAFTEGLFIADGQLFESTGNGDARPDRPNRSSVRRVDLATGRVLERVVLPGALYGEGIAPWRDQIISLTWRDGVGFRWRRAGLKPLGQFAYLGEGWALTRMGEDLVMSDGTATLRIVDPATFRVKRTIDVTAEGQPVADLNELEFVEGEILANVWMTDRITRIDPATGHVTGWIDLAELHKRAGTFGPDQVANGIAWDAKLRRLYVTGKEWPLLFEIRWKK